MPSSWPEPYATLEQNIHSIIVSPSTAYMKLGFSVRVLGQRGLRAYDNRRFASAPHLSVSLAHLRDVFAYLKHAQIGFYRMSADLAPMLPSPTLPALQQIEECRDELADVGALARQQQLRLSFHAPVHVHLASDDPQQIEQSRQTLICLATLLDAMQLDGDAVIVTHIGGLYGNLDAALGRWMRSFESLPDSTRKRLALEHEDNGASLGAALRVFAATGVPLVFDQLHFRLNNPESWTLSEGLALALHTWPHERTPKVHFSSPRTELRAVERRDATTGRTRWLLSPPRPGHHADFVSVWEFAAFLRAAAGLRDFDLMLEAKAGDLALLRLRQDLARYEPEIWQWLSYHQQTRSSRLHEQEDRYASSSRA
jgi:UV DNA damage endonuclease